MDISGEYAIQLENYMKKFSLYNVDIAYLAGTNSDVISGILKKEKGLVLKTLETISNVFGLRYYEFGNPNYPIPSLESLPEDTKKRIKYRKKEGIPAEITYTQNDINDRIRKALIEYKIGDEFLADDIAKNILKNHGENYSVSEIIDRFKKTFKSNIQKTDKRDTNRKDRGPKPTFYRLVTFPNN